LTFDKIKGKKIREVVIVSGARTAVANFNGALIIISRREAKIFFLLRGSRYPGI
jgi:ribosomal protein L19